MSKKPRKDVLLLEGLTIDSYGADARICAIADSFEVRALTGSTVTVGEIEDLLRDNDWSLDPDIVDGSERAIPPDDDANGRIAPQSQMDASLIFKELDERSAILGELYPFTVTPSTLSWRAIACSDHYLSLLAICHAHATKAAVGFVVETLFEKVVAAALAARRIRVGEMRVNGGFSGRFPDRLKALAGALRMTPNPKASAYRERANDEGADIVGAYEWEDYRAGQWWLVGQATCARSEKWINKLKEPEPGKWAKWLDQRHGPSRFLAVPHHVHKRVLNRLTDGGEGIVLDRLRLALCRHAVSKDEEKLIDHLRSAGCAK